MIGNPLPTIDKLTFIICILIYAFIVRAFRVLSNLELLQIGDFCEC